MQQEENYLAQSISQVDADARYDEGVKRLLANKSILAVIMKRRWRGKTAARCCGWTRTRKMRRRADYIKSWAMPNRISGPAYLTEYQMYSWCCWKRS